MEVRSVKLNYCWLPGGKESACQQRRRRRCGLHPWGWKIPWSRKWQPTPVFLPREYHGQRGLAGCSPRGRKGSDTTEHSHRDGSTGGSVGEFVPRCSPSCWWLWTVLGNPWLVDASLQPLCLHMAFSLCVWALPLLSLLRTPVIGFRVHPKSRMIASWDS